MKWRIGAVRMAELLRHGQVEGRALQQQVADLVEQEAVALVFRVQVGRAEVALVGAKQRQVGAGVGVAVSTGG